jgi:hypothetical protein
MKTLFDLRTKNTKAIEFFSEKYFEKRGVKYCWSGKDYGAIKRFVKYFEDLDSLYLALEKYLSKHDAFFEKRGYQLCDFVPMTWACTKKSPEEEWAEIIGHIQSGGYAKGHGIKLSKEAMAALGKMGGFSTLAQSKKSEEFAFKKNFISIYRF